MLNDDATAAPSKARALLFHLLPFLHVGACVAAARSGRVTDTHLYGNVPTWLYFLDFPVSYLTELLMWTDNPPLWLTGTLWWYLVSHEIRGVYGYIKARRTS